MKFLGFCSVFCSMGRFTSMSSLKDVNRYNQYLSTSFNLIKHLTHLLYISVRDPEEKLDGSQESQRLSFPLFFEEKEGETKKKTLWSLSPHVCVTDFMMTWKNKHHPLGGQIVTQWCLQLTLIVSSLNRYSLPTLTDYPPEIGRVNSQNLYTPRVPERNYLLIDYRGDVGVTDQTRMYVTTCSRNHPTQVQKRSHSDPKTDPCGFLLSTSDYINESRCDMWDSVVILAKVIWREVMGYPRLSSNPGNRLILISINMKKQFFMYKKKMPGVTYESRGMIIW